MATLSGVRRAKMEDYEAVLKIDDNVYDGADYLPAMYYVYLQSHKHLVLVREGENGRYWQAVGESLTGSQNNPAAVWYVFSVQT